MVLLLLAALTTAPAWSSELRLEPRSVRALPCAGDDAPADLVLVKRKQRAHLQIQGPTTLSLRLYGVLKKKGRRLVGAVKATIQIKGRGYAGKKRQTIRLPKTERTGWTLLGKAKWRLTEPEVVTLELGPGTTRVTIFSKGSKVGIAVGATLGAAESPPPIEPPPVAAVQPPALAAENVAMPDLPSASDQAVITSAEPSLALESGQPAAAAEPPQPTQPGLALVGKPAEFDVLGPADLAVFHRIDQEDGLSYRVSGAGTIVLLLHALRSDEFPETHDPVVVSLFVDDVLEQSVVISESVDADYEAPGLAHGLSPPVSARLPAPAGHHEVSLTLSDNAVAGALVSADLEIHVAEEPELVDPGGPGMGGPRVSARAPQETARPEYDSPSTLAILGGAWLSGALATPGAAARLEGYLGFHLFGQPLAVGVGAGYGWARSRVRALHPRAGKVKIVTELSSVPVMLGLKWRIPATESFAITMGLAGGVIMTWVKTTAGGAPRTSARKLAPAGSAHLGATLGAGPGSFVLRGEYEPAQIVSTANLESYPPGGLSVLLGYQLEL